MWHTVLMINSAIFILVSVFLIYAFGLAVIDSAWKTFWIALVVFIFLGLAEIVLAAMAEP